MLLWVSTMDINCILCADFPISSLNSLDTHLQHEHNVDITLAKYNAVVYIQFFTEEDIGTILRPLFTDRINLFSSDNNDSTPDRLTNTWYGKKVVEDYCSYC